MTFKRFLPVVTALILALTLVLASFSVMAAGDPAKAAQIKKKCDQFDKFEYKHLELESAYNKARDAAEEASFTTSTSLQVIFPATPVPSALKKASLAQKRAQRRCSG